MIECDNNEEFIIANLSSSVFNETLDLAFNEGEKICFKVDGPGTVHLTGNLMDEDNLSPTGEDFSMLAGSDSEVERRRPLMLIPLQMPPRVMMMMTATTVMKMTAKKRILKRLKEQSLNRRRKKSPKQRKLQL